MPYEDVSQRGKNYRIVWEEPNLSHPECLKVIAVELLNPGYKIIFEQDGGKADLASMTNAARAAINKL